MLAVLVYIASIYHVLTFWLPSLMTKLWFCDKLQNQITHLIFLKTVATMVFGAQRQDSKRSHYLRLARASLASSRSLEY